MTTQQYTCPKCNQHYTNDTSYQHVACGTVEPVEPEHNTVMEYTDPIVIAFKVHEDIKPFIDAKIAANVVSELLANKSMEELENEILNADKITNIVNQPKKRGRPKLNK